MHLHKDSVNGCSSQASHPFLPPPFFRSILESVTCSTVSMDRPVVRRRSKFLSVMNKPNWKSVSIICPLLLAVAVLAGCSSTVVSSRQQLVTEQLARPTTIWVTDFTAFPNEFPAASAIRGEHRPITTPQTTRQTAVARQVGADISAQVIEEIRSMGLSCERATVGTQMRVNDIYLRGYLLTVDEGSATKRMIFGFGFGSSELRTLVEGFQATPAGFRKIGSETVDAGGSRTPGMALAGGIMIATANPVGLIVSSGMKFASEATGRSKLKGRARATAKLVADELRIQFKANGWIR